MSAPVQVPPELLDVCRAARVELALVFETAPAAPKYPDHIREVIEQLDAMTERWEPQACQGHSTETYEACRRQAEPGGSLCRRHRATRASGQKRIAARRRGEGGA